jgi:rhodanese-related sulfurtransferase
VSTFDDAEHELSPTDAQSTIDAHRAIVVDVRQDYEREASRIVGSRHIDMDDLASQVETIPRGRAIIF